MKKIWSSLKPYLRWLILGGTLFFVLKAFTKHWREVAVVQIDTAGWANLAIALIITLLAHIWAGLVWGKILQSFQQPVPLSWALLVYLKTNIAKYLPGNVWHFYGRIRAVTDVGGSLSAATISVLLEPVLMAAAALLIALIGTQLGWIETQGHALIWVLQILGLVIVLLSVHPRFLNPVLGFLSRLKGKTADTQIFKLKCYPWFPLLGELTFLGLRGTGFVVTFDALTTVNPNQILLLFTVFSLSWVLGLIIPTPGGLGVFETTVLTLLQQNFSIGVILSVVALFRFVSILAEILAASASWLSQR